jgi:hypothetical protein
MESIPAEVLTQLVSGTYLLSEEQLRALRVAQASAPLSYTMQYVRRPWDVQAIGRNAQCMSVDEIEFDSTSHQAARGRHCLTEGRYVWHLVVTKYCSCTWIGLVDDSADLSKWLGNQRGAWVMGSNGCVSHAAPLCDCNEIADNCPLSATEKVFYLDESYHVMPYGDKWDDDGTHIAVHVDMDQRTLSFTVNGVDHGLAFFGLSDAVYPAVSMRHPGRVKYIACMQL